MFIFQEFLSCKKETIICNLESININSSTRLAYFHLSIGCHEGLLPPEILAGFAEPISPTGRQDNNSLRSLHPS
jgi:hypothetical protein